MNPWLHVALTDHNNNFVTCYLFLTGPTGRMADKLKGLESDGLVSPGTILHSGDVVINMQRPINTRDVLTTTGKDANFRPCPISWKGPNHELCIADKVQVTSKYIVEWQQQSAYTLSQCFLACAGATGLSLFAGMMPEFY